MSPAWTASSVLPNDSMPMATEATVSPSPTTSTGEPTASMPRSTAPVTTVPRPLIVSTFSMGIRNGSSKARSGSGT